MAVSWFLSFKNHPHDYRKNPTPKSSDICHLPRRWAVLSIPLFQTAATAASACTRLSGVYTVQSGDMGNKYLNLLLYPTSQNMIHPISLSILDVLQSQIVALLKMNHYYSWLFAECFVEEYILERWSFRQ